MATENDQALVGAYHQGTGEYREVPAHFIGKQSPFPGQWAKSAPAAPEQDAADEAAPDGSEAADGAAPASTPRTRNRKEG